MQRLAVDQHAVHIKNHGFEASHRQPDDTDFRCTWGRNDIPNGKC
jgi:hypothetical protein